MARSIFGSQALASSCIAQGDQILSRMRRTLVFQSAAAVLIGTLRQTVIFVTRPVRRLIMEPDVMRDTMRHAISFAMGWGAYRATGNPLALVVPVFLDQAAGFGSFRFFSKPNPLTNLPALQRLAGLSASLVPAFFGIGLLTRHGSLVSFSFLAFINGFLMAFDAQLREPPSSGALKPSEGDARFPEQSAGARRFGPFLAAAGVSLWSLLPGSDAATTGPFGAILLVGSVLFALASWSVTKPDPERVEPAPTPKLPAAQALRFIELRDALNQLFILNVLTPVPWTLAYLTPRLLSIPPAHEAPAITALLFALWAGSRINVRIQENWRRLADSPKESWLAAGAGTGSLLVAMAYLHSLWIWLPAIFLIGLFSKMGFLAARAVVERGDMDFVRDRRADYSAAIHYGVGLSGLLLVWLAYGRGPQFALLTCGCVLAAFLVLTIVYQKVLTRFDYTLSFMMGVIVGIRNGSLAAAAAGALVTLGATRFLRDVVRHWLNWLMLRIPSNPEHRNFVLEEPGPHGFARPGGPNSKEFEAGPDGVVDVLMIILADLHLGTKIRSDLQVDALQRARVVETLHWRAQNMPAAIMAGDTGEFIEGDPLPVLPEQQGLFDHLSGLAMRGLLWALRGDHDAKLMRWVEKNRAFGVLINAQPGGVKRRLAKIPVKVEALFTLEDGRTFLVDHGDGGSPLNSDHGRMTKFQQWFDAQDHWMRQERIRLGIPTDFYLVPFAKRKLYPVHFFLRVALHRQARIADQRGVDGKIIGHLHIPGIWRVPVTRFRWVPASWIWLVSPWLYEKMSWLLPAFEKGWKEIIISPSPQDPKSAGMVVILPSSKIQVWIWHRVLGKAA